MTITVEELLDTVVCDKMTLRGLINFAIKESVIGGDTYNDKGHTGWPDIEKSVGEELTKNLNEKMKPDAQ